MKTLLLTTVAALALGGVANATDFSCSAPQFFVGHESRDAQDTVNRIEIRHASNSPEWRIHHLFQNGTMVMRQEQYAMIDTSNNGYWSWRGQLRKNGAITMVGELGRDYQGQAYYMETQYDRGRITMKTRSACSQIAALTSPQINSPEVPAQTVPQPQPEPKLTPAEAKRKAAEEKRKEAEAAAEDARKQTEWEAEQKRKEAELTALQAEQARKQAEAAAEQARKQAEWEAEQARKQAEWEDRRNILLGQKAQIEKVVIPLKIKNNSMRLNVGLGDQVVAMLLDTGAASSLITNSLASSLIRDDQARYIGLTKMTTASGEVVTAKEVVIYEVKLGNQVVRNVKATVVPGDIELLLGANVLNAIGPYMVDSSKSQLIFTVKTNATKNEQAGL